MRIKRRCFLILAKNRVYYDWWWQYERDSRECEEGVQKLVLHVWACLKAPFRLLKSFLSIKVGFIFPGLTTAKAWRREMGNFMFNEPEQCVYKNGLLDFGFWNDRLLRIIVWVNRCAISLRFVVSYSVLDSFSCFKEFLRDRYAFLIAAICFEIEEVRMTRCTKTLTKTVHMESIS